MRTTLNLDDKLARRAKVRAAETSQTLTALIEGALRDALDRPTDERPRTLSPSEDRFGNGLPFPTWDGGGMPEGFDTSSTSAMIEFLEGLEAADGDA